MARSEHVDWHLTAQDLEAEVARLREYERRWVALERLVHHYGQIRGSAMCERSRSEIQEALQMARYGWSCHVCDHDCATWQPPVETEQGDQP